MISKSDFVKVIKNIKDYDDFINQIADYINLDHFDILFVPSENYDILFKDSFSEKQIDLINAYLYEYDVFLESVDTDVDSIEELYDYLVNHS